MPHQKPYKAITAFALATGLTYLLTTPWREGLALRATLATVVTLVTWWVLFWVATPKGRAYDRWVAVRAARDKTRTADAQVALPTFTTLNVRGMAPNGEQRALTVSLNGEIITLATQHTN